MSTNDWLLIGIVVLGAGSVFGIFKTKTPGFGRYSTSVLLLTLVLVVSAMLLLADKISSTVFVNVAFAITGFAGGLVTAKANE